MYFIQMYLIYKKISNFVYDQKIKSMLRKPKINIEPNYLAIGISILLNQFHPLYKQLYYGYIAYYIKSTLNFLVSSK